MLRRACALWLLFFLPGPGLAQASQQANSTFIPLTDMGPGDSYLGFEGGLFPGGSNVMPEVHAAAGLERANRIQPLDVNGNPDPNGKIVLMSVGMSNTAIEFCSHQQEGVSCNQGTFMDLAAGEPADFGSDGIHPSPAGEQKVGRSLLDFFSTSPYTQAWFRDRVLCAGCVRLRLVWGYELSYPYGSSHDAGHYLGFAL